MAVLREPNKLNYKVTEANRPIALLDMLGRVVDVVTPKRLSYVVETYQMLPLHTEVVIGYILLNAHYTLPR